MMKQIFISIVLITTGFCFAQNEAVITQKQSFSIGESIEVYSSVLQENREVNIYLPLGYSPDSAKEYPVIYLLDGSADEDFIHIAGLVQFGSFSWIDLLPESIVVGISNIDRRRDFTYPTQNKKDKADYPTTGGSEKFIQFIEQELQPLIDKNYKTNRLKTLIGQSLGGLLATEILFKKPGMFDHYLIVSPSLWWDDGSLLKDTPTSCPTHTSIYIAVGEEEIEMKKGAKKLFNKLKKINTEHTRVYFQYFPQLNHGDILHLAIYDGFKKIFKKREE